MRNEMQAALEDAILYHELQAKSIQEAIGKTNHPRSVELYEDAKRYNETALTSLREKQQRQPDPDTGLVPCGWCGPERIGWFSVQFWVRASTGKRKWMSVTQKYKKQVNYCPMCGRKLTAPPRPGAIGPDAGEMDPNGEEGEEL